MTLSLASTLITARAFARARWRAVALRDRAAIERYQAARLQSLLSAATATLPFYRPFRGMAFESLPIVDKAALSANFPAMNRPGLSLEAVRDVLDRGGERIGGHVVGRSTGTSGNRGYFVIADAERFVWLGTILAKTLPDSLWRRHRVALAMPGLSSLYRSAMAGSRIALRFFDLGRGVEAWADELVAFAPDTIVAPPKVLRWLAEHGRLPARRLFSGAEVLDALDREIIEAASGARVREIYMATEGLLGVGCAHGTLHLAEDVVRFDWQRPAADSPLMVPVITDFTRREQAMIRYRLNDLLALGDRPCRCGLAYRAVRQVVGREDDCLHLADPSGARRMVTPDVVRNAIVDSDPTIRDFRVVQTAPDSLRVTLEAAAAAGADERVRAALSGRLGAMGVGARIEIERGIVPDHDRKLRRVRRAFD